MSWIKPFAHGAYGLTTGQVIEGFQPIDFFHFLPRWYDLWLERIAAVIDRLKLERRTFHEVRSLLPPPSNLRSILFKIVVSYRGFPTKQQVTCRRVTNLLARLLQESCPSDPFAEFSNPLHSAEEVQALMERVDWQTADPQQARALGQLMTAAGSLVHGLYNDFVTDFGWDVYGPYQISDTQQHTLLIRHFPNLSPTELWPASFLASCKELILYTLYEGVVWKISAVGCHTISTAGNPVLGMRRWTAQADRQDLTIEAVRQLITELAGKASALYGELHRMQAEALKEKVMLQECFQLKKLFDAAQIDWHPTPAMLDQIRNKPLLTGIVPHGVMMTSFEQYIRAYNIDTFAREVLHEEILTPDI